MVCTHFVSVLYNIVDAYNKEEVQKAKKEHRKAELLPKVSEWFAHTLFSCNCPFHKF